MHGNSDIGINISMLFWECNTDARTGKDLCKSGQGSTLVYFFIQNNYRTKDDATQHMRAQYWWSPLVRSRYITYISTAPDLLSHQPRCHVYFLSPLIMDPSPPVSSLPLSYCHVILKNNKKNADFLVFWGKYT
jgi:hypothetical protein